MKTETNNKLVTIAELFSDQLETAKKSEDLNQLLNQEPKKEWIKQHPFVKTHFYLPIDKIEYMLRRIFKHTRIEITGQGTAFNGVWVTVRVHYMNPATNTMEFHDGIGATQLQTAKGTSPADLININNGAISMAFPIAKTEAIKDACHHFGKLFGADINRAGTLAFTYDDSLNNDDKLVKIIELLEQKAELLDSTSYNNIKEVIDGKVTRDYNKVLTLLNNLTTI